MKTLSASQDGEHFRFEAPAAISFSGGRTSAYMLRRVLDAWGGPLPPGVQAVFCNTGDEHPATLDFVQECAERWAVPVVWLEYDGELDRKTPVVREVTHATASRDGEPMDKLIDARHYLPNQWQRFCTEMLKVRLLATWMASRGFDRWTNVVGLRADEPKRVADRREDNRSGEHPWTTACPLYDAGVTVADVRAFWASQPFDLRCPEGFGNCTRCFLKGAPLQIYLAQEDPASGARWIAREARIGARFRRGTTYAGIDAYARRQGRLALSVIPSEGVSCACTD